MSKNKSTWFSGLLFLTLGTIPLGSSAFGQAAPLSYTASPTIDYQTAPVTVYPKIGQYSLVTWETLSHFDYVPPSMDEEADPKLMAKRKKSPVPGFITALNGAPVAVAGFMLPVDMDKTGEKAVSFLLCRTRSACCYGVMPKTNEWVDVQMKKGAASEVRMDIPITVFGTLEAGEIDDKEEGLSFYRMTGDKIELPKKVALVNQLKGKKNDRK